MDVQHLLGKKKIKKKKIKGFLQSTNVFFFFTLKSTAQIRQREKCQNQGNMTECRDAKRSQQQLQQPLLLQVCQQNNNQGCITQASRIQLTFHYVCHTTADKMVHKQAAQTTIQNSRLELVDSWGYIKRSPFGPVRRSLLSI